MIKIGFFGTSELAARCLEGLLEEYEVLFVVTPEDKQRGRNRKMLCCETKNLAICQDVDVLQPTNLKDQNFIDELKKYDADIYVVVAYGKLIPETVFNFPPLKTINLHPSLLPRYRGAAPMQWVLINGETESGVTVQLINEKLDAGDIVVQEKLTLDGDLTVADLTEIVVPLSIRLLKQAIEGLAQKTIAPLVQDHGEATYCGKIDKDKAQINWNEPPLVIHNLVRGLNPKPYAWTTFRDKHLQIHKTKLFHETVATVLPAGSLLRYQKKHLLVATGNGYLEIISLKPESKKIIDAPAFINGYRLSENDRLI